MKSTDFALVFIAIILPYMIVLYINITFTIKAEEMEMYYEKVINSALDDAAYQMKQVESQDKKIDYGYSDSMNKKINVNAKVGVDSFFDSLYTTFGIKGNEYAESYLDLFVPAVAVIEYDGVRVSKNESVVAPDGTNAVVRVLKPKRYFTYSYSIVRVNGDYQMVPGIETSNAVSVHTIEFTMDTSVTHRGYNYMFNEDIPTETFYLGDASNNDELIAGVLDSGAKNTLKSNVVSTLLDLRSSIISTTVANELSYAVNDNNLYAKQAGVSYNFSFPTTTDDEMYDMVDNVGIVAFVQGVSIGNRYLNTKAFGVSSLEGATRYYFTAPSKDSQIQMNLYHKDVNCPEYRLSKISDMSPRFATSKQEAATSVATGTFNGVKQTFEGFYPCPICNP